MGRKGSEASPSKRYPLRSTHSSRKVLRSATKSIKACSEPLNNVLLALPAVSKRKSGSLSESSNNSVRVLRSASKNKVDLYTESLSDSTPCTPDANKRNGAGTSKAASPINSVRLLRSASKNKVGIYTESLDDSTPCTPDANKRNGARPPKAASPFNSVRLLRSASKNVDEACNETLNSTATGEKTANRRKCVTPSKVGSPNSNLRVLRSASKNKNNTYSEPLNDNTVVQPSVKKRKTGSPLKVETPARSARVLRSNSKKTSETFDKPLNDNRASQPVSRKRKSDTPPKPGSPKLGVRVLRSASRKKDACVEPLNVSTPVQPTVKKRISGKSSKERSPKKNYLKICQRVKYILNRMNYEQSLIQAYSSEGWKGQSLEKIRPEKELERAKAEILRCKIKIREAFRNMDSLLSEGKLKESLFDSAGEIFSEDIFCAICGSKDVTLKNDIILCDGACDRGFHQNCLNPPLQTEDIPPGDEGWFCPACVCKIDCINALNELQGNKLSVHDPWEKVFPEAASLANGSKEHDASEVPPGDSEYNDYNISMDEGHMVKGGRSSAEDEVDDLGLPSDDSEDDDFDPSDPDSSEDQKNKSHSEESDFTSDSDDFCVEIAKSCGPGEVSSPLSDVNEKNCKETELDQDVVLPVSSRRQVERLDYKKLYDEAYGEGSSSSSDDEEWSGEGNIEDSDTDGSIRPAKVHSRKASAGYPNSQHTPQSYGSVSRQEAEVLHSNISNGAARRFDPISKQKLKSHFEKDPYPSRATKESLAQEIGLTFIQVDKWFASTRHSSRVAATKKGKQTENYNTGNNDGGGRNHSNEKNDRTSVDSIPVKKSNNGATVNPSKDKDDTISPKLMLQINLNEGNDEDFMFSQHPSCKETVVTTPTATSRAVGPTGYMPGENQGNGDLWSTFFEQGPVTTPTKVGPPGYGPGENQGYGESWNTISEQRIFMNPAISQEAGAPGYVPGENMGNNASWNTSTEQRFYIPTTSSREACPPGFGPGGGQVNGTSRDISSEQRVDTTSYTFSMQAGPPGYGPSEYQVSGNSWGTSNEQRVVMTPPTKQIDVGPPGYWPGGNHGNSGVPWNNSCDENVFMTPATTLSGPPGYCPPENKGNGASTNVGSPKGSSAQKPEPADEARKKAIARELRRMKKFR